MYRRRNQKQAQAQTEVVDKKESKKEEPVIKYVVQPRGDALPDLGKAPMLDTLRNINYFEYDESYPVPKKIVLDTLLSKGYLNADFEFYRADNGTDANKKYYAVKDSNDWDALYKETTTFDRKTFAPGDLIMFTTSGSEISKNVKHGMTFAFLVNKVYKADSTNGGFEESSRLKYAPPAPLQNVDEDEEEDKMAVKLSSLSDCNGVVYMFRANTELKNIAGYLSYTQNQTTGSEKYEQLRKLEPTNRSTFKTVDTTYNNDNNSWGSGRKEDNNNYVPETGSEPKQVTSGSSFNLTSGALVDGWLIYLKASEDLSSAAVEKSTVAKITGDVIKTERVAITTIGNTILNLGNVFQIPYSNNKVKYSGNNTKFASEPLNSEQYQVKYGDTVGEKTIDISKQAIYSLTKCCVQENGDPFEGTESA